MSAAATPKTTFYQEMLKSPRAVLAPMAGYTDAPFRRLALEHGAAWTVSEMVLARGFLAGERKSTELGAPYPGEPNLVVQLFGDDPEVLREAAAKAEALFSPVALDLNLGCPAPKLAGRGGACLLLTPERAYALVRAMRQGTSLEVSAKMRLGWDEDRSLEIAQGLEAAGVALLTVHGRTSRQRYQGQANWEAIGRVAEAVRVQVLGSGDVTTPEQFHTCLQTGVAGAMIGRGAVGNPWIFRQIATGAPAPSHRERIETALRHAELNVLWYGEFHGLRQLRKVLYRYFPANPELHPLLKQVSSLKELKQALLSAECPVAPEPPSGPGYRECGR
ncbi:tRNA dihydrouridine synthase [Meiothermus hypogaeus]|uniref:tRNA-dihydrouridine synthase n=2 Tax=Meiothermus hypogaeus TaxID=884155 RepID=A0A511QZ22_9DEIN|nr:tRNA-dihydrouridine synthase family protein [Meiothermus hypogaeus]RIH77883.1 putative tRNA-dihydrouridine synthase [Meiothermus hypogaeus]GEM82640.1 nifR3 protein [Meiothermus hypogaeus NBRC 106114]